MSSRPSATVGTSVRPGGRGLLRVGHTFSNAWPTSSLSEVSDGSGGLVVEADALGEEQAGGVHAALGG